MQRSRLLRMVLLRVVGAAALFAMLLIPAIGLGDLYARVARVLGRPLLDAAFEDVEVRLQAIERSVGVKSTESMLDTNVIMINRRVRVEGGNPQGTEPISSQWFGYLPTALLVSLVAFSPVPWKRLLRALLVGFVLVQAFVYFRVLVLILYSLSKPTALQLYHPGPAALSVLRMLYETLTIGLMPSFVVPLIVWVLVTFRREDWSALADVKPTGQTRRGENP